MSTPEKALEKTLAGLKLATGMQVSEIMTTDVVTLEDSELLATAARTMIENRINGMIITHEGAPWSVLTSWDLLHVSYLESFSDKMDYLRTPLRDIIKEPHLEYLVPEASLADAVRLISRHNQRTVPVLDGGKLIGLVSIIDLVKVYDKLILSK
ncbi:MAG: CBS domain-containing protein [Leptospiraceae bacterium]|nr:CBS domain-containing protein [Leptospiraceae bacterium]MCB1201032.1 CBS domain-containing protein [Leptospiraceae bacterium]